MTREEIVDLLTFARVYDGRVTVGKSETAAWFLAVQRFPLTAAQQAVVAHYQASRERIMPADIIGRIRATQMPPPVPAIEQPVCSPEAAARYKAQIASMAVKAAARFALAASDPYEIPVWRPGTDKRELALRQVEASRRLRERAAVPSP